jgi:hypothetical protein
MFAAFMPDSGDMWDCDCGHDNHAENADKKPDWLGGHWRDLTRHLTAPPSSVTTWSCGHPAVAYTTGIASSCRPTAIPAQTTAKTNPATADSNHRLTAVLPSGKICDSNTAQ